MTRPKRSFFFEFHFCFDEPHGCDVIAFDVYFVWEDLNGKQRSEMVLKCEWNHLTKGEEIVPLFRLRCRGKNFRVGKKRFPLVSTGSGGNWHWEVYRTKKTHLAFLLNHLRRQKKFSSTEYVCDFMQTIWKKRGSIQREDLIRYGRQWLKDEIEHEKERLALSA